MVPDKQASFLYLFKQQRLPALQPLRRPYHGTYFILFVATIFIVLGLMIQMNDASTKEVAFRYDHINKCSPVSNQGAFTYRGNNQELKTGCITKVTFQLNETLRAPVYLYYGLTGFYQNHRRFAASRSEEQLRGGRPPFRKLKYLSPLLRPGELTGMTHTPIEVNGLVHKYGDFVYSPAGLLPWSMFNDTFTIYRVLPDNSSSKGTDADAGSRLSLICNGTAFSRITNDPLEPTPQASVVGTGPRKGRKGCHKKGITWETDVLKRYKSLIARNKKDHHSEYLTWSARYDNYNKHDQQHVEGTANVKLLSNDTYLNEGWYAGELGHAIPANTDEDFMVWNRIASSPKFRKIYRIIDEDLEPGQYVVEIGEHYNFVKFVYEKSFVLARISWFGGKNPFLYKMCFTVGIISLVFVFFLMLFRQNYDSRADKVLRYLHEIN